MNSSLLDVLHNSADDHVFAIRQSVDVDFDGVFEEVIDEYRPVVRVFDGFLHVAHDGLLVISDDHGAPAKHVGGPHQHRKANAFRAFDGFFDGGRHNAGGLRNLQFLQQFVKLLAVFGEVDRFG